MEIKQLLIENKKKYVQICLSCGRYTHNVIDCPRIHFIRREVCSIIKDQKNIERFKLGLKNKKSKREVLRHNWKKKFDVESDIFGTKVGRREERSSSLGTTIEHFLKNLTKVNSSKNISKKCIKRL